MINTYCHLVFHQLGQIDRQASNSYFSFSVQNSSDAKKLVNSQYVIEIRPFWPQNRALRHWGLALCGLLASFHIDGLCDRTHCWLSISGHFEEVEFPWTVGIWWILVSESHVWLVPALSPLRWTCKKWTCVLKLRVASPLRRLDLQIDQAFIFISQAFLSQIFSMIRREFFS